MSNASSKWFANRFTELHPLLQKLHSNGGTLHGSVDICLQLQVKIVDGGWHWVQKKAIIHGISIPSWFVPQTEAYKTIVDGEYLFSVTLTAPFLGKLFSYRGKLKALSSNATAMDKKACE